MERGLYGRRPSPVYQHYPSHHRKIHGSHLGRRPESAGGGKVAETYKVRSVKVSQVFLGHRERSGADAEGWSFQVALITSVQHLAMTWCCSVWVSGLELIPFYLSCRRTKRVNHVSQLLKGLAVNNVSALRTNICIIW